MIWVVGGTSEAHLLGEILKSTEHIITYATKDGLELSSGNATNKTESVEDFIINKKIDFIIDVSHPFALQISKKVNKAAEKFSLTYLRYEREKVDYPEDAILVDSYEECFKILKNINGNVFFTTGSKMVEHFEKLKGGNRFIYRILPSLDSISKLRELGVEMKNIVAMLGPFSKELNSTMLRDFRADYIVTKDSGLAGGTVEKIQAAIETSTKLIIITRGDNGNQTWNNFLAEVEKLF